MKKQLLSAFPRALKTTSSITALTFVLTVCLSQSANAQLTGTLNVPGSYATLDAAITDLNTQGVGAGGVTINVIAGNPQSVPAGGYSITTLSGTAGNPIVIQGNGNIAVASSALVAGNLNDAIFKLIGADWVTIAGFLMQENPANTTTAAATNNMTEWGVALLYTTTTDGAQNNTIQGNTIDLNRTYQNTFGIYSNSTHSATAISTSVSATTAAGANSGLRIYSNSITDVNTGIVVVGPFLAVDHNDVLEIGGSAPNANTITDYGTTGTFSGYANVSGTVNGILVRNTKNFTVSFNTISSSNGGTTSGTLRGIYLPTFTNPPTGNIVNTIDNNSISLRSGVATGAINGILQESGNVSTTTSLSISTNNFNNTTHTLAASGAITFISNASTALTQSINSNTFTNMTVNTTGSVTFISNTNTLPATGVKTVNGNSIVTGFSKTGAGGTVTFFVDNGSDPTGTTNNSNSNTFSNITVTGATAITGIGNTNGGSPTKNVINNTVSNITGGTGAIIGISVNFDGGTTTASLNNVNTITNGGAITGILFGTSGAGTTNAAQNTVHTLTGTGTGAVIGIQSGGSAGTRNVSRNKIYNLENTNVAGLVSGLTVSSGTTQNIFNNLIGDLRTPAVSAVNALNGINITSTTTLSAINIYYNSVYLNATSVGANFGSSALFHTASATATTAALNLRNNILVNLSTPMGTGLTAAYRRSTTALNNFASTSNNNIFYAGTPGAANLIFYDGTNSDQTLAAYQTRVTPRDANSATENPPFLSTNGASGGFLHINPSVPTQVESGAAPIATYTTDYDGDTRNATTPDIGADEGAFTLLDILGPIITYTPLSNSCNTSAVTLNASISDASGVPTAGIGLPVLYWRINAGAYTAATGTFISGTTYQFTFGSGVVLNDVVSYYIVAQDNAGTPNGSVFPSAGASGFTPNPPAVSTPPTTPSSYTVVPTLSGVYTVGAAGDYTTLTAAIADYNFKCLGGAIEFRLLDASYSTGETFPITIQNPQASAVNTLTIHPASSVTSTISGAVASSALIRIRGNYVTIDGSNNGTTSRDLTITNTSVTSPSVIHIGSTGTTPVINNTVKNSIIINGINTSSAMVISDGATLGTAGYFNNITIQNNSIQKAYIGIYSITAVLAGNGSGLNINTNELNTSGANAIRFVGIYVQGVDGATIAGNIIGNFETASVEIDRGIWFATATVNSSITGNTISGMSHTGAGSTSAPMGINVTSAVANANVNVSLNTISELTSNGTGSSTGITVTGATAGVTIHKNQIRNIKNTNTVGWGSNGINLGSTSTAANINVNDNFISDIASHGYIDGAAVTDNGYGIVVSAGAGYSIYHNTVHINTAQMVTGRPAAMNVTSAVTAAGAIDLRNNIFSVSQMVGANSYAIYSGAANTVFSNIDYNDYFTIGPNLGFIAATNQVDLAAVQASFGGNVNSKNIQPFFASFTDLHIDATLSSGLNGTGTPAAIASVPTDIDGMAWNLPTDPGADEFTSSSCTTPAGGTTSVTGPSSFCASGTPGISNSGYSTGSGSAYQWMTSTMFSDYPNNGTVVSMQSDPDTLITGVVSTTTYYWLRVICSTGLDTVYSNSVGITINPSAASISGPSSKCENDPSITLMETGGTGTSWLWSTSETTQSISVNPSSTTTYFVTVTSPGSCLAIDSQLVVVNLNPVGVTAMASANPVCAGAPFDLSSTPSATSPTLLNEGFESGAAGWLFQDESSTGVDIPAQIFHIQPSPFSISGGSVFFTNFAVSGSNFVMSLPDEGGSGSQTNTNLVSPSFSTVGLTGDATLSFKQVYQYWASSNPPETTEVQISIDGGANWTTLDSYDGADVGDVTDDAQVAVTSTVNVPAIYMGYPNVKIRFRYLTNWGYYWILDDVLLIGSTSYTYSWSSSPAGFTSSMQNPTGVTQLVSTNYTVTVTGAGGCAAEASTGVVTVGSEVTNTNDSGPGSLRDMVACVGSGGTITFSPLLMGQTITLTSGEIIINKNLTISGLGMNDLTISGNGTSRIFHLLATYDLEIENLALKNASEASNGGAVFVEGDLILENVILQNNMESGSPKSITVVTGANVEVIGNVDFKN